MERNAEAEMVTLSAATLQRLIDARGRAEERVAELSDMLAATQIQLARAEQSAALLRRCCGVVSRKNARAAEGMREHAERLRALVEAGALSRQDARGLRAQALDSIANQLLTR